MKKYVLVIDDDLETVHQIKSQLEDSFTIVLFSLTPSNGLSVFLQYPFCLVIMSIDFVEADGLAMLTKMREAKHIPIFIISSKTTLDVKITSFKLGADDFLSKPFELEECLARARAHIRRYTELGGNKDRAYTLVCGPDLIIDPSSRIVTLRGEPLDLSQKQFDMLYYLACNAGQVITKSQLFEHLWSEPDIEVEPSITKRIHNLRRLIEDVPEQPEYIRTVRGVGYRFEKKTLSAETVCGGKPIGR